ncbi:lipopolysaccharide-induced tumor necrosis factor-alpha factor homolog [Stomoxys calcitrans]|uniref:LITAF domain-containing protein n=1 Tax=Stomoxys calcitrans TaxID=35570 RepID=A0A1I8NNT4_STOCA|nr:lipopolysaccharide-induced tumor necrosis factor-alpha factor homolog [Stomoxys calcitrans]
MDKSQPPPYAEHQPGFTPASYYQPGQPHTQQPQGLYPPMPQPQPYNPPPHQQPTVIIQTTTTRPNLVAIGNQPTRMQCPSCHADIVTTVKHSANSRTHCWAFVLCLFICWPCMCVPYCMDSCQTANHSCPNCNAYIGAYDN